MRGEINVGKSPRFYPEAFRLALEPAVLVCVIRVFVVDPEPLSEEISRGDGVGRSHALDQLDGVLQGIPEVKIPVHLRDELADRVGTEESPSSVFTPLTVIGHWRRRTFADRKGVRQIRPIIGDVFHDELDVGMRCTVFLAGLVETARAVVALLATEAK